MERFVVQAAWCQVEHRRFWCVIDTTTRRWARGADPGGYPSECEARVARDDLAAAQ